MRMCPNLVVYPTGDHFHLLHDTLCVLCTVCVDCVISVYIFFLPTSRSSDESVSLVFFLVSFVMYGLFMSKQI